MDVLVSAASIWPSWLVSQERYEPLTNNDVLRRLRYILELSEEKVIEIFSFADKTVEKGQVEQWLKSEDHKDFLPCDDLTLATFLNGLIIDMRGRKEGPQPEPEKQLNNNIILRKIKIAFDLKNEDMLAILDKARFKVSKHEITAFFRKVGHKHYRQCQDQVLRYFLSGLQKMASEPSL